MISLMLRQVLRSVAGSWASAFQKLLIQSVLRVVMMSSYTARTSGLASWYSISPKVAMLRPCPERSARWKGSPHEIPLETPAGQAFRSLYAEFVALWEYSIAFAYDGSDAVAPYRGERLSCRCV